MPLAIASFLPGASYASGTFTIPWTAINGVLATDITAADDTAKLLYALMQCLHEKQVAGTITQPTLACEIGNKSVTTGVWETSTNNFTSKYLVNHLLSTSFDSITVESGASITSI